MAIQFGIPFLVEKFNWIPSSFWDVVKDILKHVQEAPDKEKAIETVRTQLGCIGVGCPPDLKGNN